MKKLKLYVWEGVLTDYTNGVMFALAYNMTEAKKLIKEEETDSSGWISDQVLEDLKQKPQVITKPEGFTCWGGG